MTAIIAWIASFKLVVTLSTCSRIYAETDLIATVENDNRVFPVQGQACSL